jgi:hypothetical protein
MSGALRIHPEHTLPVYVHREIGWNFDRWPGRILLQHLTSNSFDLLPAWNRFILHHLPGGTINSTLLIEDLPPLMLRIVVDLTEKTNIRKYR